MYLSFCYIHSLRSPISNAGAGGAYLNLFSIGHPYIWFRSVVVITSALHAEGRQFDPGRNHFFHFSFFFFFTGMQELCSEERYVFRFYWGRTQLKTIISLQSKGTFRTSFSFSVWYRLSDA